jgi:drug/metabolite transporter (DMT)-like permease
MKRQETAPQGSKIKYYTALLFVIFIWGVDPLIMSFFYRFYSATALTALGAFFSLLMFLAVARVRHVKLDKRYLKIAVPIAVINSVACLLQKIGLQYTTPANYAFLEHLSCVVVPLTVWIAAKKRPSLSQCLAGFVCIAGCFILCGADLGSSSGGVGNVLCAAAGILLGIAVAAIGIYACELDKILYVSVYMAVYFIISLVSMPVLNFITVRGVAMERLRFSFSFPIIALAILFGLLSTGICWLIKNTAIIHTDPTAVAVISPLSAVISGVLSVGLGLDALTPNLAVGAAVILFAIIISGAGEWIGKRIKRKEKK